MRSSSRASATGTLFEGWCGDRGAARAHPGRSRRPPPIAAMQDRYEEMLQRIRTAVDAAIGPRAWHVHPGSAGYGSCGDRAFEPNVQGRDVTLPSWGFDEPITDADWPAVKRAVLDVLGEHGFRPGGMAVDTGGSHELNAYEPTYGGYFNLGNVTHTVMRVSTGCHPGEWRIYE
ncbi:LppA family lipoprotein [Pseudonocardia sp. CA-107938]|uniref:LppA family lipoprotein n=1 Tax=Pseudonocardia sp. CA-107938 TaxID=3240021 RepID=UPI003D8FD4A4